MKKQQIEGAARVAGIAAWRVVQAVVLVPSMIVGGIVATAAILGEQPVQATIRAVHAWAEKDVRPAPAGMVLVPVCVGDPNPEAKPVVCKEWQDQAMPLADVADAAASQVGNVYAVIVLMSIGMLFWAYPGRAFLGLPEASRDKGTAA